MEKKPMKKEKKDTTPVRNMWETMRKYMPRGKRVSLKEIYELVESHLPLLPGDLGKRKNGDIIWKHNLRGSVLDPQKTLNENTMNSRGHQMRAI